MFEDLIPSASAQTPTPPPDMFDDLIPAGGATGTLAGGISGDPAPAEAPLGLAAAITDIPHEVAATTREAWENLRRAWPSSLGGERDMATEGPLESFARTGQGLLAAAAPPMAPIQGVVRSVIGHPMVSADQALRQGAVGLYGEDKVRAAEQASGQTPGGMTYDEARRNADTALALIAPRNGLAAARSPAAPAPPLPTPETPPPPQIAENKAAIADAVRDVGVPPERIDPADIEDLARSATWPKFFSFEAFKRAVIADALKRGLVTPEEVEQIYGKGAADEYRGRSTSGNGEAAAPQGTQRGGPGSHTTEGQQLPGPGENGRETREPPDAKSKSAPSEVERVGNAEAVGSDQQDREAADAAGAPERRARIISGRMGGARIEAPMSLFDWIKTEPGEFFANFEYLQRKHPEYFVTPRDARNHVLDVLTDADTAIHQNRGAIALIARDGDDHLIAFDVEKRQGRYIIVTAYRLSGDQFNRVLKGAERDGELTVRRYSTPP